jgi:general stress protein 26
MKAKKENEIISKQIKEVNNQDDILIKILHNKLDNKFINLPNDESIKLLLLNDDVKKLINYTLNKHSEIIQEIEIRKKVNFYFVNNKKIDEYIKLRNLKNEKMKKLDELKKKLKNIKEQRKNCISKNEELIKEINTEDKNDKLAKLKLKILNSSSNSLIMDIQNDYKKYTYLNGYKYSHL